MQYVKYNSGVVFEWDDTIAVGTLIRTYYQGYWLLTNIEFQEPRVRNLEGTIFDSYPVEWSNKELYPEVPILHFVQVLREDGTKSKKDKKSCSACHCSRVTVGMASAKMAEEINTAKTKYAAILNYLEP